MKLLWAHAKAQTLELLREPFALFPSLLLPGMLFLFFGVPGAVDRTTANLLMTAFTIFAAQVLFAARVLVALVFALVVVGVMVTVALLLTLDELAPGAWLRWGLALLL